MTVGWRHRLPATAVAAALAVLAAGCGSDGSGPGDLHVSMKEYAYGPQVTEVAKGSRVSLYLSNDGALPHNLVIAELSVKSRMVSGKQSGRLTFAADRPGTYTFYCSEPGHLEAGMEGRLVIRE